MLAAQVEISVPRGGFISWWSCWDRNVWRAGSGGGDEGGGGMVDGEEGVLWVWLVVLGMGMGSWSLEAEAEGGVVGKLLLAAAMGCSVL